MHNQKRIFYLFIGLTLCIVLCLIMSLAGCYSSKQGDKHKISGIKGIKDFKVISTYLILKPNQDISSPWVSRFYLPSANIAYTLNSFIIKDNKINIDNELNSYGTRLKEKTFIEKLEDFHLYSITTSINMNINIKDKESSSWKKEEEYTITFSIHNLTKDKELYYQPARWALMEGIRLSKAQNGEAQVLQTEYLKKGMFRAIVFVRF